MTARQITRSYFDRKAENWDVDINHRKQDRIELMIREHLSGLAGPLLDLGSGSGILLPYVQQHCPAVKTICELDISAAMLNEARQKRIGSKVGFVQADGHFLPLRPASFKSIVCFQVFPHFQHKENVIEELKRVLQPQGMVVVWHLMGHRELNEMHRRAGRAVEKDRILPAPVVAEKFEQAGFQLIKTEERSDLYLVMARKK